ncbi:MAG: hypothetical protein AAF541_20975 [Pseudomonadota bacterium]
MTKPRSDYVDPILAAFYHIASRCVRRGWLLGKDSYSKKNYNHRKEVLINRIKHLSRFFPVEIYAYAIMDNHFHLVLRYDPQEALTWSDEEVARRWCAVFHGLPIEQTLEGPTQVSDFNAKQLLRYHELLANTTQLEKCRRTLGSLSGFMKHLKQPFSVWANREDECRGHFFESRFYSGALLTEEDLLTCMAYVDLNPVAAKIARSLRQGKQTSIHERLFKYRIDQRELDAYLTPLWKSVMASAQSGEIIKCSLANYAEQLNRAIVYLSRRDHSVDHKFAGWIARLVNRERKTRAQHPALFDYAQDW